MDTQNQIYLILQVCNLTIAILFLIGFILRMIFLRHHAITMKYVELFPKTRVFLAIVYVLLSLILLLVDIIGGQYSKSEAYMYLLAGGGGQCINSLILIFQLLVLRQELIKQRPYTPMHMLYSVYLLAISLVRLGLILYQWIQVYRSSNVLNVFDTIVSCLLSVASLVLFISWLKKRQSLPYFQDMSNFDFSTIFRQKSIRLRSEKRHKQSMNNYSKNEKEFPLIFPTVKIEKNKFRLICQIWSKNKVIEIQETQSQRYSGISSKHLEIISQTVHTVEEIRQFYILCGRFTIQNKVSFTDTNFFEISQKFQLFLNQLLNDPKNYQRFVLQFLNLPQTDIRNYQQRLKYKQLKDSTENNIDLNATFLSISIYKHLWIDDHYQFYIKVVTKNSLYKAYPMKRYTDFESLDWQLKQIAQNIKNSHINKLLFPSLPKKHYLLMDDNKINERKKELQLYLRKLCNDKVIIQCPQLKQRILQFLDLEKHVLVLTPIFNEKYFQGLDIVKGSITKALIQNQYVTIYEFRLFNNGVQFSKINKRFRQFVAFHKDMQRWMNNIQITYSNIQLPQRHLYKSEESRHQKLKNYLKTIIQIEKCYEIYELGVFLNIPTEAQVEDISLFSQITSFRKIQQPSPQKIHSPQSKKSPNWVEMKDSPMNSKRWSELIDDLGVSHQQ